MDQRITSQRNRAIAFLIFFVLLLGIGTGIIIANGLGWLPQTAAQSDQPVGVEPSRFLAESQQNFRDLVATVRPAVVSIRAEGLTEQTAMDPFGGGGGSGDPFEWFFNSPFGAPNQQNPNRGQPRGPQTYEVPQVAAGSGFIVDKDGYLLTNNHVVEGATKITVVLDDGREFDADVVGSDADTDIAVLQINSDEEFPYIEMGDSDSLQVGDWVMAIGNPFGNLAGTVTVGIVSATNRESLQLPGNTYYQNFIQTDAAINLGNSGGPLVDITGRAVGINTAITAQGSGIGFATPISLARFVYDNFREYGEVIRGWIGVTIQNIDTDMANTLGLQGIHGALVAEVQPGDPAERAGLQAGDVVLEVGGEAVNSTQTASRLIAGLPPGEAAPFLVWRDGEEITLEVTPDRRDTGVVAGTENGQEEENGNGDQNRGKPGRNEEYLGLDVTELTPDDISYYGLPEGTVGILIQSVNPSSSAYVKGLGEGMVIISINDQDVTDLDDYERLMADANRAWQDDGKNVMLRILTYSPNTGWIRQFMALPFE